MPVVVGIVALVSFMIDDNPAINLRYVVSIDKTGSGSL